MTMTVTVHELAHFSGTESYRKHWTRMFNLTDGVQYLEDNGMAWLIDIVASYQPIYGEDFQAWALTVADKKGAVTATDGNDKHLVRQELEYADAPDGTIKLFLTDGVLMLASEY